MIRTLKLSTVGLSLALFLVAGCGEGPIVWTKTIDCGGAETAAALAGNGNRLAALGTLMPTGSERSVWVVQVLTKDGKPVWRRRYSEGTVNVAGDLVMNELGEVFATGRSRIKDQDMCVVVRYRSDGSLAWQRALALGDASAGSGIVLAGRKLYVCGAVEEEDRRQLLVAELNLDGSLAWSRNYRIGKMSDGIRIALDRDGDIIVAGHAGTAENPDILLVKLTPQGDTIWTQTYDSGAQDRCGDVVTDLYGNVIATGTAFTEDGARCVILEYHPDGELIRRAAFGERATAEGHGIAVTKQGDFFIGATLRGNDEESLLVFQYRPNATSIWERTWRGGADAVGVDVLAGDDVYALGTVRSGPGGSDMVVLRLSWDPDPPGGASQRR